ncbi:MAG TPA: hypothetical protein PLX15_04495 [Candidatus Woesearchaeota archaeon]|nr:hypothetical protein [Candidatus Woesearchaeota archaeon]
MENQTETNSPVNQEQNEEKTKQKNIMLGEMIELTGFSVFDRSEMIIIKKLIGNYVRKFIDYEKGFSSLKLTAKKVHEREKSVIFEFHLMITLSQGNPITIDSSARNAFMALDEILKNSEQLIKKL